MKLLDNQSSEYWLVRAEFLRHFQQQHRNNLGRHSLKRRARVTEAALIRGVVDVPRAQS